jgi:hypothetical protein
VTEQLAEGFADRIEVARVVAAAGGDPAPQLADARAAIDLPADGPSVLFQLAAAEAATSSSPDTTIAEAVALATTILDDAGRADELASGARELATAGYPTDDIVSEVARLIAAFDLRRATALRG